MAQAVSEQLFDVNDVARILNLKVGRVYALAEDRDPARRLPSVKIGRLVRFRPEDVRRYIDERVTA